MRNDSMQIDAMQEDAIQYSSVPNRRVVPNKRVGGKILEN